MLNLSIRLVKLSIRDKLIFIEEFDFHSFSLHFIRHTSGIGCFRSLLGMGVSEVDHLPALKEFLCSCSVFAIALNASDTYLLFKDFSRKPSFDHLKLTNKYD